MNRSLLWIGAVAVSFVFSCKESGPTPETPDSPPRTPEEELRTFQIEKGFEVQLVASEPMVEAPVQIQFDQDGRLWVLEMRGYMNDMEGSEEHLPVGSVAILEDTDGDGEMDHRIVYLDSLIMPRSLGLFKNGALIAENQSLWWTEDLDGDWKADVKTLIDSTYSANGLPEHADNGFVRNLDNWFYSAKSRLRYRNFDGVWVRDSTEFRGQWGITQDDKGRLIYNYNWSQLHGDLVPANYLSRNKNHKPSTGIDHGYTIDRRVYPIRSNLAVNRGYIPGTLDSANRLLEFTSACSPTIYRSHLFPKEYFGNVFVMENAGNLVKRNVVKEKGILIEAFDPNPGKEFLASTDERFRPVHGTVGPDGGLYIVDMYQGIVQHGAYMTPYLKEKTLERKLDTPGHMGRIWRVVPKGFRPKASPKLSEKNSQELVEILAHEDGWYRDMAQRLLVEQMDPSSILLLESLIKNGDSELARLHALWTLEGMGKTNPYLLLEVLKGNPDLLKSASLRLLENVALENSVFLSQIETEVKKQVGSSSEEFALQIALSSYIFSPKAKFTILSSILEKYGNQALIRDAAMSSLGDLEADFLRTLMTNSAWQTENPDREIFLEMLAAAVVTKGDPIEISGLLAGLNHPELSWKEKAVLTGMSIQAGNVDQVGQIKVSTEPELFKRKDIPLDGLKLEMLMRLFSWPGFSPDSQLAGTNNLDESGLKLFTDGRQKYLSSCSGCHGNNGKGVTRMGPPLAGSEWVLGDEVRLSLILLHGIEGPIEVLGKKYDAPEILPVMPSHSTMDDRSIAAILTYIRNEWGNQAPAVTGRTVGGTRVLNQGRVYPWSEKELNKHMEKLSSAPKP
ncbi:cbb3-type cytochrome c oxidase subunit III [Algoriphagus boseongensis]|uniref:Cbb3-type cytochrome c oxidase subunit III n=1 Tax=Algoriphagus boseongensis TaxID=1442587 RepID=A0A4R6T4J8_9BACT|nr:c-type cytochrome [Algoriphagus boseongensis]TDQ13534.1 cbb3-type cytochrome c oxidase subunit III [Algoriphagus boseongensis]